MKFGAFLDRHAKWLFPLPAALFVLIMMIFPIFYTVRISLTQWSLGTGKPNVITGLQNFAQLLTTDSRFHASITRTLYFTVVAVVVEVVLGVAIALLLNREFRGKDVVKTMFLMPMVATPVAVGMVWLLMFEPTAGILNWVMGVMHLPRSAWLAGSNSVLPSLILVDVWEWTPMVTLISLAGLAGLPHDPFEAARVDGASAWQTLWHITLPLLRPTVMVAALLRAIDAIKTFDIIYTLTGGGPGFSSETINIFAYQQAFSYYSFGYASAVLILFFVLVLAVSLLMTYASRSWEA